MYKNLVRTLFVSVFSIAITFSFVISAVAKAPEQGLETPTPSPEPTQVPGVVVANPDLISFAQLRTSDIHLTGPQDSATLLFGLPADWQPNQNAQLVMDVGVSFNTAAVTQSTTGQPAAVGGTLIVRFNRTTIGTYPLNQNGEFRQTITIPAAALPVVRDDGRMEVAFLLDSGLSCFVNQQMNVFIHTSSTLLLPHTTITPDTSFTRFPYPLYQSSIYPESALIVVPDQPTAAELQAALTLSASLGNLTSGKLLLSLVPAGQLTEAQRTSHQLIFVGKAASFPSPDLNLPLPVQGSEFALANPDDGVLQMVNSPWSPAKVVLFVSANTDPGIVKAAQALSTGLIRPNTSPNLSIVEQVQPNAIPVAVPIDQTLTNLGYSGQTFSSNGNSSSRTYFSSYRFYIPPGQTVSDEAYFELIFGHSALLDFNRSGATISLNGKPMGSIRFSDVYAAQSTNSIKTTIPASAVLPGFNVAEVRVDMFPTDMCASINTEALWFTIWPESNLHLPLTPIVVTPMSVLDLSAYPAPFVFDPTLGSTAFILQHDDPVSWQGAAQIANYLGQRSNGSLTSPAVFFGNEVPESERAKYNFLVIGRPSQLPILGEINAQLPAPFINGDVASEDNVQVKFRVPENAPQGYVQLINSPWNSEHILIAAVGNTPEGITQATSALVDGDLRSLIAGNFSVISGTQVLSSDTRVSPIVLNSNPTPNAAEPVVVPGKLDVTPPAVERPEWIVPVFIGAVTLIGIILLVALISAWVQNRARRV